MKQDTLTFDARSTLKEDQEDVRGACIRPAHIDCRSARAKAAEARRYNSARYCDQPVDWRTRLFGSCGTLAIFALVAGVGLLGWQVAEKVILPPTAPVVVNLESFEAPPEPVREVAEGPEQVELQEVRPEPKPEVVVSPPKVQLPVTSIPVQEMPEPAVNVVDPGPVVRQPTAPKSIAAPAGPEPSINVEVDWETRVLARLERFRRYPARARAARQQGTVFVRFALNRVGQVLSAEIARSSGFYALDQAALATLRRAEPLPSIPREMPDRVELTVPVEFFIR